MSSVLNSYKRQPKIYIDIPSQFRFVKDGTYDGSFKDVPVYSMTGSDELMMKNPESLLNGSATKNLIQSCIPSIKIPGNISIIDVEFLLVAIRIASYGDKYSQHSKCPKCSEENLHEIHLGNMLEHLSSKKYLEKIKINDLTFKLKPLTYDKYSEIEKLSFETQRLIAQAVSLNDLSDDQRRNLENDAYTRLSRVVEESIASQVVEIITAEGSETDPDEIRNFILSSDREYLKALRSTIEQNNLDQQVDDIPVSCGSCEVEYKQMFTMDDSSFFGS